MFLLVTFTITVLLSAASGQVCQFGRTSNGCPNVGGNGFSFSGSLTKPCIAVTTKTACATAGGTLLSYSDVIPGGAYNTFFSCPYLITAPLTYVQANAGTVNVVLNIVVKGPAWVDPANNNAAITGLTLPSTCKTDGQYLQVSFVPGTIANFPTDSKVTISCVADTATNFLCASATPATLVIDAAWSPWSALSSCKSAPCAASTDGTQTRMRICNNPATAFGAGAVATCQPTNKDKTFSSYLGQVEFDDTTKCKSAGCSVAISMGGAFLSPYSLAKSSDVTVPAAQTCTFSKPLDLPVYMSIPIIKYIPTKGIWACGRVYSVGKWQCYFLDLTTTSSWAGPYTSNFDHPVGNAVWISDTTLVFCPNDFSYNAEFFDTTAKQWQQQTTYANIPASQYQTNGDSCCLMVPTIAGNYLYVFGGKYPISGGAVYAQRILINAAPGPHGPWELLLSNLPQGLVYPSCYINPTYGNHIYISPQVSGGNLYVYDIYLNTLTLSSQASTAVTDGIDFGEVCTDNKLYGIGSGALQYTPANTYGTAAVSFITVSGNWSAITSVNTPNRVGGNYVRVLQTDLKTAGYDPVCAGC